MADNVVQGPWSPIDAPTLSKAALARELGKSTKTVERLMARGLPHEHDSRGHARFSLPAVLAWLDEEAA